MSREQIEEIKAKLDIASIIQEYVPTLKRTGRNYFGLCPFHSEKTPSFSVNSELGIYKCFGCGESGDVFKFIEVIESYDFLKTLEVLAKRAGVKLKRTYSEKDKKLQSLKERILKANNLAMQYFHYVLMKLPQGEKARIYVKNRKLTNDVLEAYQIGYAPQGFNNIMNFLLKKGFQKQELVDMGLLVAKNDKIYDKFRDRLMFPIIDHQGDVAGFSARLIDKEALGPKYLNSPETIVYKKSDILYGLFQAKESLRKEKRVILVEGNVNILSSYRVGVKNIVASLGTALTENHVQIMRRYVDEVDLAFDTDTAGTKALIRSLELTENAGLKTKVIDIGEFKDVDELIVADGDWIKIASNPVDAVVYLIKKLATKYDQHDANDQETYLKEILAIIKKLKSNIKINSYIKELSSQTKIDEDVLQKELENLNIQKERFETTKKVDFQYIDFVKKHFLESYLLALIYHHNDWVDESLTEEVLNTLTSKELQEILRAKFVSQKLPENLVTILNELVLIKVDLFEDKTEFEKVFDKLFIRLKDEKARKELKYHDGGKDQDAEYVQKLAKERKKMMKS